MDRYKIKGKIMKKYMIYAKTNTDYAAGMITKPQNRFDPASKLASQFNSSKPIEFLFTNGDHFNFITIFTCTDDESVSAMTQVMLASGQWESVNWSRAYEAEEMKAIFEHAKKGMHSYVTTMQAAETS